MILRLEMPFLDTTFPIGMVSMWRIEEGQSIGFGGVLCEITCSDRLKLRGTTLSAHKLIHLAERGEGQVEYRWRKGKIEVVYEIVASEPARLGKILAEPGSSKATGDLLAVMTTNDDPLPVEPPPPGSAKMRVGARSVESFKRSAP